MTTNPTTAKKILDLLGEAATNPVTEYYLGSDATGTNGGSNRVLTLSNIRTTNANGLLIVVAGTILMTSDFTISHNATGSQITLLNALWNDQNITVQYFQ